MNSNEYMRDYMRERYQGRMLYCRKKLGNMCSECGVAENLHVHHIDPIKKKFSISTGAYRMSLKGLDVELEKCVLLCESCHNKKHHTAKTTHGTLSSYRYCKCELCKKAMSLYNRAYKKRKKTQPAIIVQR